MEFFLAWRFFSMTERAGDAGARDRGGGARIVDRKKRVKRLARRRRPVHVVEKVGDMSEILAIKTIVKLASQTRRPIGRNAELFEIALNARARRNRRAGCNREYGSCKNKSVHRFRPRFTRRGHSPRVIREKLA